MVDDYYCRRYGELPEQVDGDDDYGIAELGCDALDAAAAFLRAPSSKARGGVR
jgi:hypothetical protein